MRSPCFYQSLFSDVMVRFTVTLLFLLMLVPAVVVGHPDSLWSEVYGSRGTDECFSAIHTSDDCILMVGRMRHHAEREDNRAQDLDFFAVKIDAENEIVWQEFYGRPAIEYHGDYRRESGKVGIETNEGVYVLAGYCDYRDGNGNKGVVLAMNQDGDSLWSRTYETSKAFQAIVATPDSGFIVGGYTFNFDDNAGADFHIIKCDRTGEPEWEQYYVQESNNQLYDAIQTSDGGYALAGRTGINGRSFHLVKVDSVGEFEWSESYGAEGIGVTCWAIAQCEDGGYILAGGGGSNEHGYTAYAVRTDENGEQLWGRIYEQGDSDFFSVLAVYDGFVFGGRGGGIRMGHNDEFYLVRTDEDGEVEWETIYGGHGRETCYELLPMPNGGYAMAGYTNSFHRAQDEVYGRNFWLLKTGPDPENNSVKLLDPAYPSDITLHSPYPNPFNSTTTINFSLNRSSTLSLGIYSLNGQLIEQLTSGKMEAGSYSASFTVGSLPSGVYIAQMQSEGKTAAKKLVLLR